MEIQLWFANNKDNKIITIDSITNENKGDSYKCPLCGSAVIPKAIKENAKVQPHFAHIDKSKCTGESIVHWWVKNQLLKIGDGFALSDGSTFVCKEINIEKEYNLSNDKKYKPDISILTTTDETVFIEINHKNKKKIDDYINIWSELNCPVVEVSTKELLEGDIKYKILYKDGKTYSEKKSKVVKYKEEIINSTAEDRKEKIKRLKQLDWIINDIRKYKKDEFDKEELFEEIVLCENPDDEKFIVNNLLSSCVGLKKNYKKYRELYYYKAKKENILNFKKYLENNYNNVTIKLNYYNYYVIINIKNKQEIIYDNSIERLERNYIINKIQEIIKAIDTIKFLKSNKDFKKACDDARKFILKENNLIKIRFRTGYGNHNFIMRFNCNFYGEDFLYDTTLYLGNDTEDLINNQNNIYNCIYNRIIDIWNIIKKEYGCNNPFNETEMIKIKEIKKQLYKRYEKTRYASVCTTYFSNNEKAYGILGIMFIDVYFHFKRNKCVIRWTFYKHLLKCEIIQNNFEYVNIAIWNKSFNILEKYKGDDIFNLIIDYNALILRTLIYGGK